MTERFLTAAVLVAALAGCGQSGEQASGSGDAPESVRVTRFVTPSGDRIVSYQAFYHDGLVTYHDYEPFGDADLVSWERGDAAFRLFVREGFDPKAMPADGPEPEVIDERTLSAFATISSGVDVSVIPWTSNAHGSMGLGGP